MGNWQCAKHNTFMESRLVDCPHCKCNYLQEQLTEAEAKNKKLVDGVRELIGQHFSQEHFEEDDFLFDIEEILTEVSDG